MDCSQKLCRLCLAQNVELFDFFASCDNSEFSYASVVELIAPETVCLDLSKDICAACIDSCNEFLGFRERIQASHSYQKNSLRNKSKTISDEHESIVIEYIEDDRIVDEEKEVFDEENLELNSVSDVLVSDDISLSGLDESDEEFSKGEVKLSCSEYDREFLNEQGLLEHCKSHPSKARLLPCPVCKRKFTSAVLLKRHEIIHSDLITAIKHETNNRCLICNDVFEDKPNLDDHIREHKAIIEKEEIGCLYCNKTFSKLNNLSRHLKSHEENKTHLCNVCNKTFAMGQELVDHLNRHKGFLPHTCHICNKSYLQASKLKNHLKSHANDKEFLCTECGKSFNRNSNLRQHLLRHVGLKKFHCSQCPAKFVSKGNLTAHMSTHDAKKPFACQICGSSFTQSYSLVKHNRIHTGERPFQCEFCDMRFYSSDHLKRHIRTHTGLQLHVSIDKL